MFRAGRQLAPAPWGWLRNERGALRRWAEVEPLMRLRAPVSAVNGSDAGDGSDRRYRGPRTTSDAPRRPEGLRGPSFGRRWTQSVRLNPGEQLGAYEVVDLLGSGGMAEVYRARDTRLGRDVAVKVVRGDLSGNLELFARLEQEARLAGSLNHPNIVAVHDVGVHDGHPYLVTELLDGETLRQRLSRGPVPFSQALDWAAQMARGLAAAHERGIVHRDLKPENVFIGRSGHLKLLDFGLAKPAVVSSSGSRGLLDGTLAHEGFATRSGAILGSPGYMSPEQVRGGPLDVRSDIFNLGAIIYELLAGQKAFPGASLVESGSAILNGEPPPLPASIPVGVAELVRRCLNKEPQLRFQSAQDLAFSLEAMRTQSGATSASAP